MLTNPRADDLSLIVDFVAAIEKGLINSLYDFNIILPNWKRTRIYHYWSAIRDLKLAELKKNSISLTSLGKQLADKAKFNKFRTKRKLTIIEKEIIKNIIIVYKPIKNFLSYFISTNKKFVDFEQLKKFGKEIIIGVNQENKKRIIITTASGDIRSLTSSESYTTRWTLKLWCKELDIIDEIWIEKDQEYRNYLNVDKIHERIFYPIKLQFDEVDINCFKNMLNNVVKEMDSYYLPIPILTYIFCKKYFISVKNFHSLLIKLFYSDPYHYYLETGSTIGVNERYTKIRDYNNYPRVDGYLRSYLLIRK